MDCLRKKSREKEMKAIGRKPEDLWEEVDRAISEHTTSGYKMACIEAEKVFYYKLKEKGYPTKNIKQILALFGWKLSDKDALKKALEKTNLIKTSFDYTLSSFEAEDIVKSFQSAVADFTNARALSWQRKITLFWDNYISIRSSFAKMFLLGVFLFFLLVEYLASPNFGGPKVVSFLVAIANFIFSWFILLLGIGAVIGILVFLLITFFEKNRTKIKEIK